MHFGVLHVLSQVICSVIAQYWKDSSSFPVTQCGVSLEINEPAVDKNVRLQKLGDISDFVSQRFNVLTHYSKHPSLYQRRSAGVIKGTYCMQCRFYFCI